MAGSALRSCCKPGYDRLPLPSSTALAFLPAVMPSNVCHSLARAHHHMLYIASPPPPPRPWNQAVLDFSLSDQVFARARVADVTSVNLWLGADVMLEYTLEDAQVGGCVAQSKPLLLSGGCGGLGAPGWARS